jgi:hypothetical protein
MTTPDTNVVDVETTLLKWVGEGRVRLSKISEPLRQRVIDMAMRDVALVDTDGDWVTLTLASREFISKGKPA